MQASGGMDTSTGTKDTAIPLAMLLQSQIDMHPTVLWGLAAISMTISYQY